MFHGDKTEYFDVSYQQTMAMMNKQLKLPEIQKIMMEFEKQVS